MFYADYLVIITDVLVELDTRHTAWKHFLEGKELRVNLARTNMMISDIKRGPTFTSEKHPREFC